MDRITPSLLLIADISGYTRFMRLHDLATSHARQIIVRLLKALIATARPPLRVADLEGDAVFFVAPALDGNLSRVAAEVKAQMPALFQAFNREISALAQVKLCVCEACVRVRDLKLKQVAHCGPVTFEKIHGADRFFGIDVIVVHRMLKNSVPGNEYLLISRPAYGCLGDFYAQEPQWYVEELEGVGEVEAAVISAEQIAAVLQQAAVAPPPPPLSEFVGWKLRMHLQTILELLRLRPGAASAPAAMAASTRVGHPESGAPSLSVTLMKADGDPSPGSVAAPPYTK